MRPQAINIVGAGMAGSLLAVLLAKRGFQVSLYDKRPDPRQSAAERGRSINLALAARGMHALERAGLMDAVRPLLIEMRGRMIHDATGETKLLPYGWKPGEVIYSVGRAALTRLLVEAAARFPNVTLSFNHTCIGASAMEDVLRFRDEEGDDYDVKLTPTIGADGAGSVLRTSFAADGYLQVREELLDHDYKELTLPPLGFVPALDMNALHVWPRGGFMLIALPNTDGSFTATLFLAKRGARSFESLTTPAAVSDLFAREFADAVPLIPRLLTEFFENPQGQLGTVHTAPWHVRGQALLLGDAAHAIVPFHGQGMNAAFEDCVALDTLIGRHGYDWRAVFAEFEGERARNSRAIAEMALENYLEMRDEVRDAKFELRAAASFELERRFPGRWVPRYSMVMFHPEIPYADAQRRGAIQMRILRDLTARAATIADVDFTRAAELIGAAL